MPTGPGTSRPVSLFLCAILFRSFRFPYFTQPHIRRILNSSFSVLPTEVLGGTT